MSAELAVGRGRRRWLALGAIAAEVLFVGGWLVLGALEGRGYSPGRHDVSDLGALGASHPAAMLAIEGASGILLMAFAIGALRPALTATGKGASVSAWLVALSLPALDNLGDVFFRLDCRAADAGCSVSQATGSWHGKAHYAVFFVAVVPTIAAPFALAHRMRAIAGWRRWVRAMQLFGLGLIAGLLATAASSGTGLQGWVQRALIVYVCSGVVVLAAAVLGRTPVEGVSTDAGVLHAPA